MREIESILERKILERLKGNAFGAVVEVIESRRDRADFEITSRIKAEVDIGSAKTDLPTTTMARQQEKIASDSPRLEPTIDALKAVRRLTETTLTCGSER